MAEWAAPSLSRRGGLPQRRRRLAHLPGAQEASQCLWPCAAPGYRWSRSSTEPSLAPPLDGSSRLSRPLARLAEPLPQPRLASAPAPLWPLALGRCPLPALSPRCRQAAPEGAPGQPLGLHAEGRALRSDGALGDHIRDSSWGCGAVGILKKQKSSSNKMGRRNGEHGGTNLQMSNIGHENLSHWNLELEPVPENKNFLPGRENASGGKINKNHLEIPVEQLMVELNLSDHTHKRIQNNKAGIFQLWSYPLNDGSTTENRDLKKKPSLDTGYNITNNPMRLFGANNPLTNASVDKQVGSYHGLQVPFSLSWPYADGDFLKGRTEPHITLYSTTENNDGETIFAPNWNLKYGCSSMEENLTDESDLSENEKANDTLLNYFKKMDLNLKPETIETVEDSFTEESSEIFPYPDFLPPPFNTLDLHKLALSKSDNWKATVEPPESSIDRLMTRLLEMERLQHITVQKERPRLQSTFYTSVVTERPSSSKAIPKMRQPKLSDSLSLQTTCADKSREKRRTNSGSYKLEQAASKWNWGSAGKYKWNSRPTKSSSSTRPLVATYDECKNPKSSILIPCQELSAKPTSAQTNQSLVKMISTRCLPPRSPIAVSPIPLSFPENPREEIKAARTKKKLYRKNIVLNRPFYIQKLNCLSPSFTVKEISFRILIIKWKDSSEEQSLTLHKEEEKLKMPMQSTQITGKHLKIHLLYM